MSKRRTTVLWLRFLKKFRDILIAGLVVTVPIGLTAWVFVWLFNSIDGLLQPIVKAINNGEPIPGVGFGVIFVLVLIIGVIATNVLGRRIVHWVESMLSKVPIIRTIYVGIRQIAQSFADPEKTGFMQVVLIEYPRKGIHTLGFVTNEYKDRSGRVLVNVFVPTAPNPMSGFVEIVEETEIIRTDMSIEEGLKLMVSAGRMSPKEVGDKMLQAKLSKKESGAKDD